MHALMLVEAGTPVLLGLLLEINALVIAIMIVAFVLHEITSLLDLAYAWRHREVRPIEQHVHNYLVLIPFMAMSFAIVLHWPQALALFGSGPGDRPTGRCAGRSSRCRSGTSVAILAAIVLLEILPYGEELLRTVGRRRAPGSLGAPLETAWRRLPAGA